jgi:ligand-binding sensor domain-containing protein
MAEDAQGRLWIATIGGLFRRLPSGAVQSLVGLAPPGAVHAMLLDGTNRLWLGGTGGLAGIRIDADPPQVTATFTHAGGRPLAPVDSIYRSSDGTLWIGSLGLIRFRFDAPVAGERFRRYPSSEILGTHSISAITEDVEANLWLSVQPLGAARIARERIYAYSKADGLESQNCAGAV